MGLIQDYLREVGETWDAMSKGNFLPFMPDRNSTGDGTPDGTGDGTPNGTGSGGLSARHRQLLEEYFHTLYGRYPISEHEFQTWIRNHW